MRGNTLRLLVGTRFQFLFHSPPGVLFTFPSRYSFTIGRQRYLALDSGLPSFPLWRPSEWYSGNPTGDRALSITRLSLSLAGLSRHLLLACDFLNSLADRQIRASAPTTHDLQRLTPYAQLVFGLFPFRSPLLRECSLFLQLLRCFSSLAYLNLAYLVQPGVTGHDPSRVSPFGHLRINVCSRLPEAFRSLPRPSSALGAKASTSCP